MWDSVAEGGGRRFSAFFRIRRHNSKKFAQKIRVRSALPHSPPRQTTTRAHLMATLASLAALDLDDVDAVLAGAPAPPAPAPASAPISIPGVAGLRRPSSGGEF